MKSCLPDRSPATTVTDDVRTKTLVSVPRLHFQDTRVTEVLVLWDGLVSGTETPTGKEKRVVRGGRTGDTSHWDTVSTRVKTSSIRIWKTLRTSLVGVGRSGV